MRSPAIENGCNQYTDVRATHVSLSDIINLRAFREREQPFKLSAGGMSRAYFDMKQIMFDSLPMHMLAILFNWHIEHHVEPYLRNNPEIGEYDNSPAPLLIGGMEMGAIPLSTMCLLTGDHSKRQRLGFFTRKEPKGHGTNALVDGIDPLLLERCPILIVEDVTTSGASAMKSVDAIRSVAPNAKIVGVLAILDREEGGDSLFRAANIPLHAIYLKRDFTVYA